MWKSDADPRGAWLPGPMDAMSPADLVHAIEANAAELLMRMGAAGGGEQREDPSLRWTIGGSPIDYHTTAWLQPISIPPTPVRQSRNRCSG